MPGIAAHRFAAACRNSRSWCAASANLWARSEEHTSELQSQSNIVCRLLLEKKELRQFVDAGLTQPSSHSTDARVVADLEDLASLFVQVLDVFHTRFCVNAHRAELDHA